MPPHSCGGYLLKEGAMKTAKDYKTFWNAETNSYDDELADYLQTKQGEQFNKELDSHWQEVMK